ncbi:MAG: ABC-three component system middle component 2 [Planctomycetaceae bacterium]
MGQLMSHYAELRFWSPVFNSPLECGLRALVILTDASPRSFDLQRLMQYDYLLVHSNDVAALFPQTPTSIHPATPNRAGELVVRRELCQLGLRLMISRGLVACSFSKLGIHYEATDLALPFLDNLTTRYVTRLRSVAEWLNVTLETLSDSSLNELINAHLGKWGAEFVFQSVLSEFEDSK